MEGIWLMYQLMRESWQAVIDGGLFYAQSKRKAPVPVRCRGSVWPELDPKFKSLLYWTLTRPLTASNASCGNTFLAIRSSTDL